MGKAKALPETVRATVRKPAEAPARQAGRKIAFPVPKPWPQPVQTAALLDEGVGIYSRYLVLPEHAANTIALWTLHTWTFECFDHTARLAITSPERRCGKTLLETLLRGMVCRPLPASNLTSAGAFRVVEGYKPTLLLDEADTWLRENEALRGILNSGHTRGAGVIRVEGDQHEPRLFETWSPVAIAMIGKLNATLADRAIEIRMRRKRPDEQVTKYRSREGRAELEVFARKACRWATDTCGELESLHPHGPDCLNDRQADCWESLLAIAQCAGPVWVDRAWKAAVSLAGAEAETSEDAWGPLLLSDIRLIFEREVQDRMFSAKVVEHLIGIEEHPWVDCVKGREMTPRYLAKLLKRFEITPGSIRIGAETAKGYQRIQFEDAWARYTPSVFGTAAQASANNGDRVTDDGRVRPHVTDILWPEHAISRDCDDVPPVGGGADGQGVEQGPEPLDDGGLQGPES